jgi:hypothetical protein
MFTDNLWNALRSGEVEGAPALLLAWGVVFAMDAVTFPLPPAWMVLASFRTYFGVPLLPLTIGDSAAAAFGRLLYARQVRTFTHRLPADARANAEALATAAHTHLRWPWLFVVIYSFLPVSSDRCGQLAASANAYQPGERDRVCHHDQE